MPAPVKTPAVVVVLVTCPNRRMGQSMAEALVKEGLAACVNLIPGLTSTYRWQGKLCRGREVLLLAKTRKARFSKLADRIRELHPLTVPEILAIPVALGSPAYLSWVLDSTR